MHAIAHDSLREESPRTSPVNPRLSEPSPRRGQSTVGGLAGSLQSVHTRAVATALSGPTVRRHWGLRFAAYLGALSLAVIISAVLFRIVSVEYVRDPVTGWYVWASGTACVLFGTLIFLDRDQRANGLLLAAFGILWQLPWTDLLPSIPVWAIFFIALNDPLPFIVLSVVLLRFPERRFAKTL